MKISQIFSTFGVETIYGGTLDAFGCDGHAYIYVYIFCDMITGNLRSRRREITTEIFDFLSAPTCCVPSENLFCFIFVHIHLLLSISHMIKRKRNPVLEKITPRFYVL